MPKSIYYPPSIRPALVGGRRGNEFFVTLKTRSCPWAVRGDCDFCGVGNLDGDAPALDVKGTELQIHAMLNELKSKELDPKSVLKLSFISMSDSLFNPRTIQKAALVRSMELLRETFRNILEVSIESRADMIKLPTLRYFDEVITRLFGSDIFRQVVCGLETPYEAVRLSTGKGIEDAHIFTAAQLLGQTRFGLRGYFIYNLFEQTEATRKQSILDTVEFMRKVAWVGSVPTAILILRGYVP